MFSVTDTAFKEKLRSIHFGAPRRPEIKVVDGVKHVELLDDTSGRRAGMESHKPDGTWDCTMTPEVVRLPLNKES